MDRLVGERCAAGLAVPRARVAPIGLPRLPFPAEPLEVGVAVLGDDGRHPLGMTHGEPESGGGAVVEDVQRVACQSHGLDEAFDHPGKTIEAVIEGLAPGRRRVAEAREIGGDDAVAIGQEWDQIAEHVRGGREAVQQEEDRRIARTRLPVEDADIADLLGAVADRHSAVLRWGGSVRTRLMRRCLHGPSRRDASRSRPVRALLRRVRRAWASRGVVMIPAAPRRWTKGI